MSDQQQSEQQPVFQIEKIYVKDLSLEIPHAPQVFLDRNQPEIDMQLRTNSTKIDEGYFENVLTVTVTAKAGDKTMFLAEASQAGIFQIRNVPEEDMSPILGIGCPNILFPYVRETISDMVNRAGFPPVILAPINFEVLYAQQQASNEQPAPAATH
ncbi:protein-export chaperone SecB [Chitinivorax sp. B]|uniref:protein-export chaperone SecB n=1 Tax=Chitinivorax sp. B TaxID=2502235 RepID=UPI0010FA0931|nr:protein-export chaperone SecB [Chitinivorax sp. B]